ncbi:hypothetical protein TNCV_2345281 [Trichonephila clavipes]|nr:hypothetical protein TNCV_2345281 [Trichonephila clavipes]
MSASSSSVIPTTLAHADNQGGVYSRGGLQIDYRVGLVFFSVLAVTKRVFQLIDCGTSCVTCCAVLLEPQFLDIMIVQFRNEKVSNHGSIPITIDSNVVAFVFEEVQAQD